MNIYFMPFVLWIWYFTEWPITDIILYYIQNPFTVPNIGNGRW